MSSWAVDDSASSPQKVDGLKPKCPSGFRVCRGSRQVAEGELGEPAALAADRLGRVDVDRHELIPAHRVARQFAPIWACGGAVIEATIEVGDIPPDGN